jgi:hypothetical protein
MIRLLMLLTYFWFLLLNLKPSETDLNPALLNPWSHPNRRPRPRRNPRLRQSRHQTQNRHQNPAPRRNPNHSPNRPRRAM